MKKIERRRSDGVATRVFLIFALAFSLAGRSLCQDKSQQGLNFRMGSQRSSTQTAPPKSDSEDGKRISRDPGVKLGWTSKNLQIPPELRELAQAGANAISQQDWKKARDIYVTMTQKDTENPLGFANLGVAEFQLKNFVAAEGNLRESLRLNPFIAQNWVTLGLIQFQRGELLLAVSSLTRAIHEDPKSEQAYLYLAAVTFEKGWTMAAIDSLNQALELNPDNGEAHYNLALTYLTLKPPRMELAKRHYHNAIELGQPSSAEIDQVFSPTRP